jgi:hypothetical protein
VGDGGDGAVADATDGFVDCVERREEPFAGVDGVSEAVVKGEVELGGLEGAVEEVFELGSVDVGKFVRGYEFDFREEVGGVVRGVGDAGFDFASGDSDLFVVLRSKAEYSGGKSARSASGTMRPASRTSRRGENRAGGAERGALEAGKGGRGSPAKAMSRSGLRSRIRRTGGMRCAARNTASIHDGETENRRLRPAKPE